MRRLTSVLAAVFLAVASAFSQNEIKVQVPNIVSADEQFNVTFVIEGDGAVSGFEWSQGDDFQLVWGPQKGSSSSVSIINGKTTRSSQVTYTYILLPRHSGICTIPAASASVKGGQVSSKAVSVEVVGEGAARPSTGQGASSQSSRQGSSSSGQDVSSEDIFMKLELSKSRVVVGEPVKAVIKLYQRASISGFEDVRFPSFNGFWSQEVDAPSNVEFHRETYDGQIYNAAVLRSYVLIPQQSGSLSIDPAELVCLVNVRTSAAPQSIFDSFFQDSYRTIRRRVSTDPATVHVSALPAGVPSSFGGGVGRFNISVKAPEGQLKAHEASSLVITISGSGNVSLLEAPDVSFPVDFEVYDIKAVDGTSKADGRTSGSKSFEYPFIPRSHGSFEIPSVKYSYYDVSEGRYVTLSTQPIAIDVAKSADSGSGFEPVQSGVLRKDVRDVGSDIRFIVKKQPKLKKAGSFFVLSTAYWVLLILVIAGAVCMHLVLVGRESRHSDVAGMRRRGASKVASKRLAQAGVYLKGGLSTAFYEEMHKTLLGYVGDKLGMDMSEMNKENISRSLALNGVDEAVCTAYTDLLDACEFARYAPDAGSEAMESHYNKALEVISMIDGSYKGRKGSSAASALIATLVLFLSPLMADAAGNPVGTSLWDAGSEAYDEGRWDDALDSWMQIESSGLEAADLYYNIGNAYFRKDDVPQAILYYEKALKLDPSSREARFNLEYTSSLVQDRIDVVPEFFLRTWFMGVCRVLPSDAWAVISLLALVLSLALVLLFFHASTSGRKKVGFYGGILSAVLFVLSLSSSVVQKKEYMSEDAAIVTAPVVSAKSAPSSEGAKDLFVIHEGTRIRLMDNVGPWYNIELGDGRQGWVRMENFEII